jgi:hypothetical protein
MNHDRNVQGANMLSFFRKYAILISFLLFLTLLISVWLFPSSGLILGILFLLLSFAIASFTVVEKHRQAYLQGKISGRVCERNILFDIDGILLALILAGMLGGYIAEIVSEQISYSLTQLVGGIMIGLLVGIAVGILVKQAWGRLVKFYLKIEL